MAECACGQQQALWKPVDNSCGKPKVTGEDAMPLQEINLLYSGEIVDALVNAVALLDARVESLEVQLLEVLALFDAPLSKEERIERIREIRERR